MLAVRVDAARARRHEIAAFLGLGAAAADALPAFARASAPDAASARCEAHTMYDALRARIAALPELAVLWGGATHDAVRVASEAAAGASAAAAAAGGAFPTLSLIHI